MKRFLLALIFIASAQTLSVNGFAQSESPADDLKEQPAPTDNYDASETAASPSVEEESIYKNEADTLIENKVDKSYNKEEAPAENGPAPQKFKSMSELDKLTPFNDIAVIQKRFLPKSQRFELNPNVGLVTNNAFFRTSFLQARLAYAFTEKLALEFTGAYFMDQKYKVTQDLKSKAHVDTKSLLLPEMYYGADVRWSPIYGKMGSFSEGIVPFDMYFSGGGGIMKTNQDTTPFAIHAGTGQIFALSKAMAFRWDLSMYFYSSDTAPAGNSGGGAKNSQSFTDVQLSLGMSFFFPDATYR
jgi:outer membrane beta-barrel protein